MDDLRSVLQEGSFPELAPRPFPSLFPFITFLEEKPTNEHAAFCVDFAAALYNKGRLFRASKFLPMPALEEHLRTQGTFLALSGSQYGYLALPFFAQEIFYNAAKSYSSLLSILQSRVASKQFTLLVSSVSRTEAMALMSEALMGDLSENKSAVILSAFADLLGTT